MPRAPLIPGVTVAGKENPIIFIVGCPRSGTYLLSSILNSGGRIAIPTETHFIPLFHPYLWLAGNMDRLASRRRLARAIFIFLRIWLARAEEERDFAAVSRHSLLAVEDEAALIAKEAGSYEELVLRLFGAYAKLSGAALSGDKSAFFDHMPLERLDASVGGHAKFIHVIRDGRDVCVSWRKIKVGPRTAAEAARSWSGHIRGKRPWGASNPDRYHEMRYEALLADPEGTLREVCGFIGVPYSDDLLNFHEAPYARDIANSTTHARLARPLDSTNKGKWKTEMSPAEIECFEAIAERELIACGYSLSHGARQGAMEGPGAMLFAGHRLRLALKGGLPACALAAAWFHFPLDRLCNSRVWLGIESYLTDPTRRMGRRIRSDA